MKIYVIKKRQLKKGLVIFSAVVVLLALGGILLSSWGNDTLGVFNASKELPIYSVDCSGKKAAITFDCAWGADDIPEILASLKKENVKATFFVVGKWAEKFPDALKQIAKEGHDIANHGYSHLRMSSVDKATINKEISVCNSTLGELSGVKIELFRPPYGDYNNDVVTAARELGCYTIQWSVDSLDWKPGISQQEIQARIMRKLKPGAIILFHNDTPHTAKLLPTIIKDLKNDGYELEPVSKLIKRDNYFIDYEGRQRSKQ